VTMTFSTIYTWLEKIIYMCIHKPVVGSHYRPIINCQLDPKGEEAIILYTHMHFITNKFHLYHSDYILQEL